MNGYQVFPIINVLLVKYSRWKEWTCMCVLPPSPGTIPILAHTQPPLPIFSRRVYCSILYTRVLKPHSLAHSLACPGASGWGARFALLSETLPSFYSAGLPSQPASQPSLPCFLPSICLPAKPRMFERACLSLCAALEEVSQLSAPPPSFPAPAGCLLSPILGLHQARAGKAGKKTAIFS